MISSSPSPELVLSASFVNPLVTMLILIFIAILVGLAFLSLIITALEELKEISKLLALLIAEARKANRYVDDDDENDIGYAQEIGK